MVARQANLLLGGRSHDGNDEGGNLKDQFMNMNIVSVDAERAIVGVCEHSPTS